MNSEGHPARQWNRNASTVAVLLLSLVIAACETTGSGSFGGSAESRAERLAQSGEYEEAASAYIGLAAEASGGERDRLTLLAVDNWLDAGDAVRAQNAFSSVARPQGGELLWRWDSTNAALLLFRGEAERARDLLEALSRELAGQPAEYRAKS
jgi:outer membrane PBP1 activator LpoA protein